MGILSDAENEKDEHFENQGGANSLSEPHMLESHSSTGNRSSEASHDDRKTYYLKDDLKDEKEHLIKVNFWI